MVCSNENSIGPAVQGCRDNFDFTVYFEQIAFAIIPSSIFIALSLVDLPRLLHKQRIVIAPQIQWLKQLFAVSYSVLKLAVLATGIQTWSRQSINQHVTLAASSLDLITALIIIPLSWLSHARSPRPSILIGSYLAVTLLFDIVSIRTAWLLAANDKQTLYNRLITATAVLKAVLLIAESRHKKNWLVWNRKDFSPEETSGIYSLGVFAWLNRLFIRGYKGILTMKSLYPLDEALVTETVGKRFAQQLKSHPLEGKKGMLLWRLLSTLRVPILLPLVPRIAVVASNLAQPLLIEAVLNYIQREHRDPNHGYGLIVATVLTYGSIAISTALYGYLQQRFTVMMRGCLVHVVYEKTTKINLSQADDANVITLMSTDVGNAVDGLRNMHEYWANLIQVGIASWLLYGQLGTAFVAPIVVVILSILAASYLGSMISPRQATWMEAIELRVGVTANAISQMKLVKMAGMTKPVQDAIQALRVKEMKIGGRWRNIIGATAIIAQLPMLVSPVVTLAVASTTFDPTTIFVSISYLALMTTPLSMIFQQLAQLVGDLTCMNRIQRFLESPARKDYRRSLGSTKGPAILRNGEMEMQTMPSRDQERIQVHDASFGWHEDQDILKNVNATVAGGELTAVVGPVASGKTTFCKALLGEIPFIQGSVSVSPGSRFAYCDQQPFLSNATLRRNIIGYAPFSHSRYSQVIQATMLDVDFDTLPEGDQTVIGSGGIALSGGQRQRVSIARALYLTAVDVLIFDDVLSGLDSNTDDHLFRHIFAPGGIGREGGAAIVLCTHNMRHVSAADRVLTLTKEGSVTERLQKDIGISDMPSTTATIAPKNNRDEAEAQNLTTNATPAFPTLAADDQARKLGDSSVYRYYFAAVGKGALLLFIGSGVAFGFLSNFPRVWLSYWAEDTARGADAKHSQAYYIGIYGMLEGLCVCAFMVTVFTVVRAIIRQTGTVLHEQTLETVVNAPLQFFTTTDTGLVTNYFSQDLNLIDTDLPISLINLSLDLTSVVGMAAVLASSSPWLALSYPALFGVLWIIQKFYLRTSRQMRLLDLEAKSPLYSHFLDTVKGIATIRAFGWEKESVAHNVEILNESQRPFYLLLVIQRWLNLVLNLVILVIATGLVALITQLEAGAGISGASLVTLMSLSGSLMAIVSNFVELETCVGAVARLRSFSSHTASEKRDTNSDEPKGNWPSNGRIDIKGVWASYSDSASEYALRDLDVTVQAGEKVAICGRTGSGKSSIILMLLGLLRPMEKDTTVGKLVIDDVPLDTVDCHVLRERIITVPQDPVFLPPGSTVGENLDPLNQATLLQCESVLRDVGLLPAVERLGGLHGILNEAALSQGQRQMFNLARAVLKKRTSQRSLLLLDEFTASVDRDTEQSMLKLVEQEFKGCTIVMISHRLDMVLEMFDTVLVMDNGVLVESGRPRTLSGRKGSRFAQLLEVSTCQKHL